MRKLSWMAILIVVSLAAGVAAASAQCGDGVTQPGEECDPGPGTCIGGSNAGTACTADSQCDQTSGVCLDGVNANRACDGDSACPSSSCIHCRTFGGNGCAVNCTTETAVNITLVQGGGDTTALAPGTSGIEFHADGDFNDAIVFPAGITRQLLVGKEGKDGKIPVALKSETNQTPAINALGAACVCLRPIVYMTCGGTLWQQDGTPSTDCSFGYTAGSSVCPQDKRCTAVYGPDNIGIGEVGCAAAGLDGVNTLLSQSSIGANETDTAGPVLTTLSGTGGAGSAVIFETTELGFTLNACKGTNPAIYGQDGKFCTADDPYTTPDPSTTGRTVLPQVLTTGIARATITNAKDTGNTINACASGASAGEGCNGDADCGGSPCLPRTSTGVPLTSCSQLFGGNLTGTTLADAFPSLNFPAINDIVVIVPQVVLGSSVAIPTSTVTNTPTVTPTRPTPTFSPTRTPTNTPTVTPTFTPTVTPTATPTGIPGVLQLTSEFNSQSGLYSPRISGDGSVVLYSEGPNVMLVTADGRRYRALTDATSGSCVLPQPSTDANRVAMLCFSNMNSPDHGEIVLLDGINFVAVTTSPTTVDNDQPRISDDGNTIVFTSNGNYTGGNVDGSEEIFLWRNGQPLQQVTRSADDSTEPQISGDGQRILFERVIRGTGGEDSSSFVYLYDAASGTTSQIASTGDSASPQLNRDGQWALFTTHADLVGSNPSGFRQLYAQRIGGAVEQLTQISDQDTSVLSFAVNADASRVAVVLSRFVGPTTIGQGLLITSSGSAPLLQLPGDATNLSFDSAGRYLAFLSSMDPARQNPNHVQQLFVALLPFAADTPTPTRAPTGTPTPTPLPALSMDAGATDTTIFLNDVNPFPFSGIVQIDGELIFFGSESGNVLFNLTRGACGTTAAAHGAGALVTFVASSCPPTPTTTITGTPTVTPTPSNTLLPTATRTITPAPSATPSPTLTATPVPCVGDCNGSGQVTIDEILTLVNIALGDAEVASCEAGDANLDGQITVDEILTAVNNALTGCG